MWLVFAPLLVAVAVAGMLVGVLQAGVRFSGKALEPNWEKLSPSKGWSNLLSQKSAMRGVMAVAKLLAIGALVAWTLSGRIGVIAASGQVSLISAIDVAWDLAVHVMLVVSTGLFVVGIADYFYQRIRHEEELKMTRQELTEEHKRDEGDPQIRARLKKLRREYVQKQMLRDVPRATVVLTNPEHFAVALRYDRLTMPAPVVVAKGADLLAQRIAKIARENGVPVLQRKPLSASAVRLDVRWATDSRIHVPGDRRSAGLRLRAETRALSDKARGKIARSLRPQQQHGVRRVGHPAKSVAGGVGGLQDAGGQWRDRGDQLGELA